MEGARAEAEEEENTAEEEEGRRKTGGDGRRLPAVAVTDVVKTRTSAGTKLRDGSAIGALQRGLSRGDFRRTRIEKVVIALFRDGSSRRLESP